MANFEIQIANKTINYMLMIKKELYTSPEVKVFNVRIEGVVCTSTNPDNCTETLDGSGFDFTEL